MANGNPDADQDKQLIYQTMHEVLGDVFHQIGTQLAKLTQENESLKTQLGDFLGGVKTTAKNNRRKSLSESVKFDDDFDDHNDVYKEMYGQEIDGADLKEEFLNHIVENDISDDEVPGLLSTLHENTRSRFGKWVKPKAEVSVAIGTPEAKSEEPKIEEPKEPEGKKGTPRAPVDEMWEALSTASKRGK